MPARSLTLVIRRVSKRMLDPLAQYRAISSAAMVLTFWRQKPADHSVRVGISVRSNREQFTAGGFAFKTCV